MPFQVKKVGQKYMLWKINEKVYAKKQFNSRETAIKMGKRWIEYRGGNPVVVGNKILHK